MGDDMIDALGSVDDAHCGTSGAVGVLLAVCCRLSFPRMGVAPAVGIVPWVQFDWQDSNSLDWDWHPYRVSVGEHVGLRSVIN